MIGFHGHSRACAAHHFIHTYRLCCLVCCPIAMTLSILRSMCATSWQGGDVVVHGSPPLPHLVDCASAHPSRAKHGALNITTRLSRRAGA